MGVGGTGRKVTVVHISLASIQSSVQNVTLFCKKRFMIFKINLVNLFFFWLSFFFKMVIFQMAGFPNLFWTWTLSLIFSSSAGLKLGQKYLGKFVSSDFWMVWNSIYCLGRNSIIHIHAYNKLGILFICFSQMLAPTLQFSVLVIVKNQGGEQC